MDGAIDGTLKMQAEVDDAEKQGGEGCLDLGRGMNVVVTWVQGNMGVCIIIARKDTRKY